MDKELIQFWEDTGAVDPQLDSPLYRRLPGEVRLIFNLALMAEERDFRVKHDYEVDPDSDIDDEDDNEGGPDIWNVQRLIPPEYTTSLPDPAIFGLGQTRNQRRPTPFSPAFAPMPTHLQRAGGCGDAPRRVARKARVLRPPIVHHTPERANRPRPPRPVLHWPRTYSTANRATRDKRR